jgi:hypothetical protein
MKSPRFLPFAFARLLGVHPPGPPSLIWQGLLFARRTGR